MYRGRTFSLSFPPFTAAVKWLVIANAAVYLALTLLSVFAARLSVYLSHDVLALVPLYVLHGWVWQVVTYSFVHEGLFHILFNMLALWMFGAQLETDWGKKKFYEFYFFCVIGAAITTIIVSYTGLGGVTPLTGTVGASGGVPTPEEMLKLSKARLRKAGLSGAKILSMKDLAQKTIDGVVPTHHEALKLSDEELVERLDSVRGIGAWTVEMFLIFRLGRPDVLPIHDLGVQKGWSVAYRKKHKPRPKELLKFGERWRPYRTVASWYMWRAFEKAGYATTNKIKKPRVKRKVMVKIKRVKIIVRKKIAKKT